MSDSLSIEQRSWGTHSNPYTCRDGTKRVKWSLNVTPEFLQRFRSIVYSLAPAGFRDGDLVALLLSRFLKEFEKAIADGHDRASMRSWWLRHHAEMKGHAPAIEVHRQLTEVELLLSVVESERSDLLALRDQLKAQL